MKKIVPLFILIFLSSCSYPTTNEVDKFISGLDHYEGNISKFKLISAFLNSLRKPDNEDEDAIAKYGLRRLREYYVETRDNSVLEALSTVKIRDSFAYMVCAEVKNTLKVDETVEYFKGNCRGIERCLGVSFSKSEIRDICE